VKHSKNLSLVFATVSIMLISWSILVVAGENGLFENKGMRWMSDSPSLTGVTTRNGYYVLSFSFSSLNYSRELQNIIINPRGHEPIAGLTGFINGTVVSGANPIFKYIIDANDSLQVNVMFPLARFSSGTTVEVQVLGASFGTGGQVVLP
jgi:hypothetical protein